MIAKTIDFLKDQLEEHLQRRMPASHERVMLTSMFEGKQGSSDGYESAVTLERVGMTVVNIEEEKITKVQTPISRKSTGALQSTNPEIKLNLYILFAANSANYSDSLKLISDTIGFFQSKYLFTVENSPALDPSISRLMLDLYTVPLEQQNYLWGALGAQYLPSVVYKARVLHIQEDQPLYEPSEITEINTTLGNK